MKKVKPCRLCAKKKFGSASLCFSHWRDKERAKREESKARKLARRLGSKRHEESQRKRLKAKLDTAFSLVVRLAGRCERCGTRDNLQCSHIYSRSNLAVRWDLRNATCLCAGCHIYWWHKNPVEASEWLATVRSPEHLTALKHASWEAASWSVPQLRELLDDLNAKLEEAVRKAH